MIALRPRSQAQAGRSGIAVGAAVPFSHDPMQDNVVLSRLRNSSLAVPRSLEHISAHRTCTGKPLWSMTSVIRPSTDWRVNSTGRRGPSFCQSPTKGSSRGHQISDPSKANDSHGIVLLPSRRPRAESPTSSRNAPRSPPSCSFLNAINLAIARGTL